jgi:hypothetical protein
MASLNTYLKQTQRLLRDAQQTALNPLDLTDYINNARREVAMRAQCVRVLPLTSGAVASITVASAGTSYVAPTVSISAPDYPAGTGTNPTGAQATATAVVVGGTISSIILTYGGQGYFQPSVTITDSVGKGAVATATTQTLCATTAGQEVYPFSAIDLSSFAGVSSIHLIGSVSVIFSQFRYSLQYKAFSEYQALIRQYSSGFYQYVPAYFSQFGQGVRGSLYMYPIPNQTYQLEIDCICLPSDLVSDQDYEAIPDPWTDAVPYFAAHLAYLELQNLNAAKFYEDLFDKRLSGYSSAARSGRRMNPYGRG